MSLKTALQSLVDEQARTLVSEFGPDAPAVDRILRSESAVLNLLSDRYDLLDEAIHNSDIPFVELGGDGRIVYANAAFNGLIPEGHGSPFPHLFGSREADVCAALKAPGNTSLRVDIEFRRRRDAPSPHRDWAAAR